MKIRILIGAVCLSMSPIAAADFGRLLATGGLTTIEGAGGGGIVPWATLSSYAEQGQWGGTLAYNHANVRDYQLDVAAATLNYDNRVEFSYARQRFTLESLGGELEQAIYGVKYRLYGDVVYGKAPQISMGALHKKNTTFALPNAVGAADDSGTDFYLAATKAWLDGPWHRTWLANLTVRATKANEMGLLGFGGDKKDDYSLVAEASVGMFINRHWIVGVEYRQKPNHLNFADEQDWHDVFVGWFPTKRIAVALAYTNLKTIAGAPEQSGVYGSVQVTF
ncbi:DUF3034 family protein [Pseudidiomarina woesei]|uniref:MetA-pathway of phenol degradation n=1 Tax=Pseudidiomarina woesei TaxID=1381080 RepID=A0A0K6GXY1_9GAMM|nr:DUF3034 family protein [Pseudidiomarina woesei]CUA83373.1 Protein of unknown function (DUF3034) [Pseudidiomarina woesei]